VTEALLGLQAVILWLLWDIRRALRLRPRPRFARSNAKAETRRAQFPGAVPPERFVVVRWPQGLKHYGGCDGASARKVYEHQHPSPGEEVEFWELGDCRGRKGI
jgi:hypothetical protein